MLFTNEIYSQFYNVIHVHRIIFFRILNSFRNVEFFFENKMRFN